MNVFLDSGAFSAWRKNEVIDIDKYIEFCHKHKDNVEVYATLDVIGDPEKTWENHRIMEKAGLSPLPVYHCGSPVKYLHKCMDYEYFGLGGIAAQSEKVRLTFLDHVFKEISDKKGIPKHKTHGLGMTSFNLMREYPFYSVDSTSFALYAAYGIVLIPRKKNGQYDYTQEPYQVFISSQSNKKGYGAHFKTMPKAAQDYCLEYFEHKGYQLGTWEVMKDMPEELHGVASQQSHRREMNIIFFLDFMAAMPKWPWPVKPTKKTRRIW